MNQDSQGFGLGLSSWVGTLGCKGPKRVRGARGLEFGVCLVFGLRFYLGCFRVAQGS